MYREFRKETENSKEVTDNTVHCRWISFHLRNSSCYAIAP